MRHTHTIGAGLICCIHCTHFLEIDLLSRNRAARDKPIFSDSRTASGRGSAGKYSNPIAWLLAEDLMVQNRIFADLQKSATQHTYARLILLRSSAKDFC
jgi:hypothetical protein